MDIERLKVFKKVAELKNFTRAAEELFMTQPAISKNIKIIENFYEVNLFNRLGNHIELTESGIELLNYSNEILKLAEEAKDALKKRDNKIEEKIALGAGATVCADILPEILKQFVIKNPRIHFSVEISNAKKIIEKYVEGRIDIGIVGAIVERSDLNYHPFVTEKLRLIVSGHHPWSRKAKITASMLKSEPFFLREKGSGLRSSIEKRLLVAGVELRNVTELPNNEVIVKLVEAGIGVAIVSENAIVKEDIKTKNIQVIDIEGIELEHHYYLIYHEERSNAINRLLEFLMSNNF